MNLLPCPRHLRRGAGFFFLPEHAAVHVHSQLPPPQERSVLRRFKEFGFRRTTAIQAANLTLLQTATNPAEPDAYALNISKRGIAIRFDDFGGLCAAVATLRQLLREYGRKLPSIEIRDWADFRRRGVMLDISRGRVPNLKTLLQLVDDLAGFKINEVQLYTEHTFASKSYRRIWQSWGAITAAEIHKLDARCRDIGIDLVPNQNSFGHLREFLADPALKHLGEVSAPYEGAGGEFLRYPSTLAPNHPKTIPFLRGLYDELLPNFSSKQFNVGCDETWDLGRGQSGHLCKKHGKGSVYLRFLKRVHREVTSRGKQMMFWGDIVLNHPELIPHLPRNSISLNWGYEADHPFSRETSHFAKAGIPFYVCPGTSTWMSLIGRHDNALPNLHAAATAGKAHGALGYLITDWGDGGHPQPLAVSWLPYLTGAALSWCAETFAASKLVPVLSRDIFHDRTQRVVKAAMALGAAHRKLQYFEPNLTPLGAVVAAPPPQQRELFCRNGLKYYARISPKRIKAAWREIEKQRSILLRARPSGDGELLRLELDLAARMAGESCRIMLWQQALASGNNAAERKLAAEGIKSLENLEKDFENYWPVRNKGITQHCSAFLRWRIDDYRNRALYYPPSAAKQPR